MNTVHSPVQRLARPKTFTRVTWKSTFVRFSCGIHVQLILYNIRLWTLLQCKVLSPFWVLTKAGGLLRYTRVSKSSFKAKCVTCSKPCICGNQDHSHMKYSFSYTRVIILVTTLRTTSGRGPKPYMDLDFTHALKMSDTTRKITRVCAVVTVH